MRFLSINIKSLYVKHSVFNCKLLLSSKPFSANFLAKPPHSCRLSWTRMESWIQNKTNYIFCWVSFDPRGFLNQPIWWSQECLWHYLLKYVMGGQKSAGRWAEGGWDHLFGSGEIYASIGWEAMANEIPMSVPIESKCPATCRETSGLYCTHKCKYLYSDQWKIGTEEQTKKLCYTEEWGGGVCVCLVIPPFSLWASNHQKKAAFHSSVLWEAKAVGAAGLGLYHLCKTRIIC